MESRPLSVEDVAKMNGVTPKHIYALVNQKKIPHYRLGAKILFRPEAIEAWIKAQETTNYQGVR